MALPPVRQVSSLTVIHSIKEIQKNVDKNYLNIKTKLDFFESTSEEPACIPLSCARRG
jgi:hypothetical protein